MGRWSDTSPFFNSKRSFYSRTVEQQTNARTQAMNAMAEMVHALQIGRERQLQNPKFLAKDKESITTKRALTMPAPTIRRTWRFHLIHFLSQEPYFVEFREWIENDLISEGPSAHTAIKERNLEHEDAQRNVCADHRTNQHCSRRKRHMRFE